MITPILLLMQKRFSVKDSLAILSVLQDYQHNLLNWSERVL
jgi:hypothetical protein